MAECFHASDHTATSLVADVGADLVVATSVLAVNLGLGLGTASTLEVTSLVELAGRGVDVTTLA